MAMCQDVPDDGWKEDLQDALTFLSRLYDARGPLVAWCTVVGTVAGLLGGGYIGFQIAPVTLFEGPDGTVVFVVALIGGLVGLFLGLCVAFVIRLVVRRPLRHKRRPLSAENADQLKQRRQRQASDPRPQHKPNDMQTRA
jgi:uncharacterized membrane protein YccC